MYHPSTIPSSGLSDHALLGIQSYPSGYALGHPYNSSNANFLEPVRYDRSCMGGGSRRKKNKNKNKNKTRRSKH